MAFLEEWLLRVRRRIYLPLLRDFIVTPRPLCNGDTSDDKYSPSTTKIKDLCAFPSLHMIGNALVLQQSVYGSSVRLFKISTRVSNPL